MLRTLFRSLQSTPGGFPSPNSPALGNQTGIPATPGAPACKSFLVLWFDGNFNSGSDGSDGSRPTLWTDRSCNRFDMSNQGNLNCQLRTVVANGAAPSGAHTIQMDGRDSPFLTYIGSTLGPNPFPDISAGYSFYWTAKMVATPSSSGLSMLFDEATNGSLRIVPEDTGGLYGYRDAVNEKISTTPTVLGIWRSGRVIFRTDNTVDYFLDGVPVTWAGAHTWTFTPNNGANFVLGQLQANQVTGFSGFIQTFLWYNVQHTPAQQRGVDNFIRQYAGMSLLP